MIHRFPFRPLIAASSGLAGSCSLPFLPHFAIAVFFGLISLPLQPALAAPLAGSDAAGAAPSARNQPPDAPAASQPETLAKVQSQRLNWHLQSTITGQGYPSFSAKYSGANSLPTAGQARETVSLDFFGGYRLWRGAEFHADLLTWQGFGLNGTLGIEDFPDGEAYKLGVRYPHSAIARFFIRQTIGLGRRERGRGFRSAHARRREAGFAAYIHRRPV